MLNKGPIGDICIRGPIRGLISGLNGLDRGFRHERNNPRLTPIKGDFRPVRADFKPVRAGFRAYIITGLVSGLKELISGPGWGMKRQADG